MALLLWNQLKAGIRRRNGRIESISISTLQSAAFGIFITGEGAARVPGLPEHLSGLQFVMTSFRHRTISQARLRTFKILSQNEVDDATHCIGSVDCRSAVRKNFHPFDCT